MIDAVLAGKLSCLGSEDALTAAVFGRLRYLPATVLARWLNAALPYSRSTEEDAPWSGTATPEYVFWPSWPDSNGGRLEPDLVLRFGDAIVVLEAKLWSGKSGSGPERDQIARQWIVGSRHYAQTLRSARLVAHVYLTAHLTPPVSEFADSLDALKTKGCTAANLRWVSWASLASILAEMPDNPVASDLLLYLREVGVTRFGGWHHAPLQAVAWRYDSAPSALYWRGTSAHVSSWRYRDGDQTYWSAFVAPRRVVPAWTFTGE